tara:strand:- start:123 stop:296 length:174 start_codon:yes stop_codon:yes gene_type:complete
MKKTFEIQLLAHIEAETRQEALKEFLKTYNCSTDDALDIRDIESGEDAVELTYIENQ